MKNVLYSLSGIVILFLTALGGAYIFPMFLPRHPYACARAPRMEDGKDGALRTLLGVSSLVMDYELPEGEPYYLVTTLKFENGKRIGKGSGFTYSQSKDRRIRVQMLWSPYTGKALLDLNGGSSATMRSEFWQKDRLSFTSVCMPPCHYEGYTILGFASGNLNYTGEEEDVWNNDFSGNLAKKKHVEAVVIKTFKTEEESSRFRDSELGLK